AVAHAGAHPFHAELDPAPVDVLVPHQIGQQLAALAADVENPAAGRDHVGDDPKIGADFAGAIAREGGVRRRLAHDDRFHASAAPQTAIYGGPVEKAGD